MNRRSALCALLLAAMLAPRPARAYAWMIRHGYTACATCHQDPSGAGLLTAYGRAQGEVLLQTHFGGVQGEADPSSNFLWNALKLPEQVLAGGGLRAMPIAIKVAGGPTTTSLILMQADLAAGVHLGGFRAAASVGAVTSDGSAASIAGNLISREYWAGYAFGADEGFLLRAGRINVPFGLRTLEHTLWVRQDTRTDLNDTQQHGVAFAYTGEQLRAEVMAILGNYQIRPDARRERGYSGYLEFPLGTRAAVGLSSLVTHAASDIYLNVANTRQAHGVFARASPWTSLVLLAEANYVVEQPAGLPSQTGLATMVQADFEPLQGLHLIATGETNTLGASGLAYDPSAGGVSYGGWLGVDWFFGPHLDVRVDLMERSEVIGRRLSVLAYMLQGHVYF